MRRNEIIQLSVAVIALAIVLIIFKNVITTAQAIEITILFVLVLVTTIYVKRTSDIAKATKAQAEASVQMAEATKKQAETLKETVSMSVRPFVALEVINIKGGDNYSFEPPAELYIELQNTGKGPARNLVVTCEAQDKKVEYSKKELPSLNVGDKRRFSIHRTISISGDELRVAYVKLKTVYNDELEETRITTLLIEKDGGDWKPGEITSKRLFGGEND